MARSHALDVCASPVAAVPQDRLSRRQATGGEGQAAGGRRWVAGGR